MPVWGKRPIAQITARDVRDVVRAKAQTAKPQARNLLGYAKRPFTWAVNQDCYGLEVSPATALKPSQIVGEKVSGDRVLTDVEVFALHRAARRMGYPHGFVYRMLLLSGLRLNEVADAHRAEFDLLAKLWIVPKERMKGKNSKARPHVVPLTDDMLALLREMPGFDGGYLFSTDTGNKPVWMTSCDAASSGIGTNWLGGVATPTGPEKGRAFRCHNVDVVVQRRKAVGNSKYLCRT